MENHFQTLYHRSKSVFTIIFMVLLLVASIIACGDGNASANGYDNNSHNQTNSCNGNNDCNNVTNNYYSSSPTPDATHPIPTPTRIPTPTPTPTPTPEPTPTPTPTQRTLATTASSNLNVNSTGYQSATYATGYIAIANSTTACVNAGQSLPNPPLVILQSFCFYYIDTYYNVPARASIIGSSGNYPLGQIFYCGTCYGVISSGFNNGQDAHNYVLQSDIQNAVNQLANKTITQAKNDLNSRMNSNEHMMGSPQCTSDWQSNHRPGDPVATFTVSVDAHCTVTVST